MFKKNCISILCMLLLTISIASAQSEWSKLEKSLKIMFQTQMGSIRSAVITNDLQSQSAIPIPQRTYYGEEKELLSVKDIEGDLSEKHILKPGQGITFAIDGNIVTEDTSFLETLSSEIEAAIAKVPSWLQYDLRYKFRAMPSNYRTEMVKLINSCPKKYLDEVAYTLTYLAPEVLKDSRFANTWNYLLKNAELIYIHADSLKYVHLVEYGDTNSGDWYTTTEYKIKKNNSYIWREVDRKYYYEFIVMPKIQQEGVYVNDNKYSVGQRTWGYAWRDYLWNDPDSNYSYRPVNISSYKVVSPSGKYDTLRVDSVPRLGEIMQMPEYLWDEKAGIWFFLRDFGVSDHALNILGNWASRCIPMDVTSSEDYRPSQPNQIAWKHIGNCHEDALLIVAAARTALIPAMHTGDFCDDHVWGMIHDGGDSIWHHFEFFRGGCSPGRPYYWGMTNMQTNGNYGWASSLVQGFMPCGALMNVSDYYTKTAPASRIEISVTDTAGNPVDGAKVNLYSANIQYGASNPYIMSAGYLWTDSRGKIVASVGSEKKYYMKIEHPDYGSYPETSGQVYVLIKNNTVAGKTYKINYVFPGKVKKRTNFTSEQIEYEAEKSLKINLSAKNITVGNNPEDGQRSFFQTRTGDYGALNVYVLNDESSKKALYRFDGLANGSFNIPIPKTGKTYIKLVNDRNTVNYIETSYSTEIVDGANFNDVTKIKENKNNSMVLVYPNPASERINVNSASNVLNIKIIDIDGRVIKKVTNTDSIEIDELAGGIYFIQLETIDGKYTQKFIKK